MPREDSRKDMVEIFTRFFGDRAYELAVAETPELTSCAVDLDEHSSTFGLWVAEYPGLSIKCLGTTEEQARAEAAEAIAAWTNKRASELMEYMVTTVLQAAKNTTFAGSLKR